jgi:hypothetical protein
MRGVTHDIARALDLSGLRGSIPSDIAPDLVPGRGDSIRPCSEWADVCRFVEAREGHPSVCKILLHPYSAEEYLERRARLFLTHDARGGFGLVDNELISLFSYPGMKYGSMLVSEAKRLGASYLTCFDVGGVLVRFYEQHGFQEVSRAAWDPDRAASNWCYKTFGSPDMVEMSL